MSRDHALRAVRWPLHEGDAAQRRGGESAPQPGAPRDGRRHRRHLDRVVRLLPLRDGRRARLPEAVLPGRERLRRRARLVRHLRRRLRRPARRRGDLRPLRRPHRPQGDADLDAAADGHRQHADRRAARRTRTLGFWAPTLLVAPAPAPGHRRGRRVGRLGHAVHGVGQPEAPRLHRQLAAGRRADRPAALHRRRLAVHPHSWATRSRPGAGGLPFLFSIVLVGVGLWVRLGVLESPLFAREVENDNVEKHAAARDHQARAARDPPQRAAAHVRAGAVLHLHRLRARLRHRGRSASARTS